MIAVNSSTSLSVISNPISLETVPVDATVPPVVDLSGVLNITNLLFALQNTQQDSQTSEQEAAIHAQAVELRAAMERIRQAAEQAREAAEKGSFWSDLASTAKVVAAVATVAAGVAGAIGTGGLSVAGALAIAGALISLGARPVVKELGGSDELALGVEIAGGALSLGAGTYAAVTGAGAATTGGKAAETGLQVTARQGRVACALVQAGATGVEGYADIRAGTARGDGIDAEADGIEARAHKRISQGQIDELIAGLKELGKSFQRAKQALIDTNNEVATSNNMLVATLGR
jgi:hypothetical protein